MPNYFFNKKLPSCFVDKALISRLEKYLLIITKQYYSEGFEEDKLRCRWIISDKFGDEEFTSVENFHRDKFSNDTIRMKLAVSYDYRELDIIICFSKDVYFSKVEIKAEGNSAKSTANQIAREIDEILSDNRTIHQYFYGKYAVAAFVIITINNIVSTVDSGFELDIYSDAAELVIFTYVVIYFLIRLVSPYSTFDTLKENTKNNILSWVIKTFGTILLGYWIINIMIQ